MVLVEGSRQLSRIAEVHFAILLNSTLATGRLMLWLSPASHLKTELTLWISKLEGARSDGEAPLCNLAGKRGMIAPPR